MKLPTTNVHHLMFIILCSSSSYVIHLILTLSFLSLTHSSHFHSLFLFSLSLLSLSLLLFFFFFFTTAPRVKTLYLLSGEKVRMYRYVLDDRWSTVDKASSHIMMKCLQAVFNIFEIQIPRQQQQPLTDNFSRVI